jgi:hypothetical protein
MRCGHDREAESLHLQQYGRRALDVAAGIGEAGLQPDVSLANERVGLAVAEGTVLTNVARVT